MARPVRPGPELAAEHEARAREYRRLAELLLEREDCPIAAGTLLYESAKQCINPGSTGAKRRFLNELAGVESAVPNLLLNWRNANLLHVHADRGHLSRGDFEVAWASAQTFIDQMLLIYGGNV